MADITMEAQLDFIMQRSYRVRRAWRSGWCGAQCPGTARNLNSSDSCEKPWLASAFVATSVAARKWVCRRSVQTNATRTRTRRFQLFPKVTGTGAAAVAAMPAVLQQRQQQKRKQQQQQQQQLCMPVCESQEGRRARGARGRNPKCSRSAASNSGSVASFVPPPRCVRLENHLQLELFVYVQTDDFNGPRRLLPQTCTHLEMGVGEEARIALRRGEVARMFVLGSGSTLVFEQIHGDAVMATCTIFGDDGQCGKEFVVSRREMVRDITCSYIAVTPGGAVGVDLASIPESPLGLRSHEVMPGTLFSKLPKNVRDLEFNVGEVLCTKGTSITLKIVRCRGTDWCGSPLARVRVVQGGLYSGKLLTGGTMYLARLETSQLAATETVGAHRRLGGFFGQHPSEMLRFEGALQLDFGAWLLLFEDFGSQMSELLSSNQEAAIGAVDADRCAIDLFAALAALHDHGLHHLRLSPNSIWLRRDAFGRLRLKLGDLGVAERTSRPLLPLSSCGKVADFAAPEMQVPQRLEMVTRVAVDAALSQRQRRTREVGHSSLLGSLKSLDLLPTLRPMTWLTRASLPKGMLCKVRSKAHRFTKIHDMKHWCEGKAACCGFARRHSDGAFFACLCPPLNPRTAELQQQWQQQQQLELQQCEFFLLKERSSGRWWPWERSGRQDQQQDAGISVRGLLMELSMFAELPNQEDLAQICRDFSGPFWVPPGRRIFRTGDVGDFLYVVLAGEIVSKRGNTELRRYQRGDFVGEAALLGRRPASRVFSAFASTGGDGCAVLRIGHTSLREHLNRHGALSNFLVPSRRSYLAKASTPLAEPKAVDAFAAGAVWCQLVAGPSSGPLARLRKAESIDTMRTAVATRDLGNFYFTVREERTVALITLCLRRAPLQEALRCLQSEGAEGGSAVGEVKERSADGDHDDDSGGWPLRLSHELQKRAQALAAFSTADSVASDAVLLSVRASEGVTEWAERLRILLVNRYGRLLGEALGNFYGSLFAKDNFWLLRPSSTVQRFPLQLVEEAESGNFTARWQIAFLMAFESELCERTGPLLVPSVRPAFVAGFQIGAAIGRNRAVNFKTLWVDAFLGSFFKQLFTQMRLRYQRMKGALVNWDLISQALNDAVARGQSARRTILQRRGRLPTTYDSSAPKVLKLLPSNWVPDIGLPLASGIGRGFFKRFRRGWHVAARKEYMRPTFETWDLDDVPPWVRDLGRDLGAQQAAIVAASVGDTVARDMGWHCGNMLGSAWGMILATCGRQVHPSSSNYRTSVAGGYLDDVGDEMPEE